MIALQFVDTAGLSSEAIDWYEHGWCSHVDAVLPDGRLLGARVDGGVQMRAADYLPFTKRLAVDLPCPFGVANRFYDWLHEQIGAPYDLGAIAGFVADRDWRDPGQWFCSELIGAGLEISSYFAGRLSTPANKLTPADLLLVLSGLVPIGETT